MVHKEKGANWLLCFKVEGVDVLFLGGETIRDSFAGSEIHFSNTICRL